MLMMLFPSGSNITNTWCNPKTTPKTQHVLKATALVPLNGLSPILLAECTVSVCPYSCLLELSTDRPPYCLLLKDLHLSRHSFWYKITARRYSNRLLTFPLGRSKDSVWMVLEKNHYFYSPGQKYLIVSPFQMLQLSCYHKSTQR